MCTRSRAVGPMRASLGADGRTRTVLWMEAHQDAVAHADDGDDNF